MIYSLLQPVHLLEDSNKRSDLVYTLTWTPTLPSYGLKVRSMVSDKLFWNPEPSNNLVEHKVSGCLTVGFYCRHSLSPFREVINSHYNMMVPPSQSWVAIHKIEPPLSEGTGGDYGMSRG